MELFDLLSGEKVVAFIIFIILIFILLFIIFREFNCWYWKINDRKDILLDIRNLLEEINGKIENDITVDSLNIEDD